MHVQKPLFVERLFPSLGKYLAYSLSFPMVLLASAPFGWATAFAIGFSIWISLLTLITLRSPMVVVDEFRLSAGRFSLPLDVIGECTPLTEDQVRVELGPKLSALAKLVVRGDLKELVKVQIRDANDPTPYVLISTRDAEELVGALRANRP
ncbi:MAG: hypothetical protein RL068_547 [Actinomycetota bacterium]|jgi:hypothetical protein